VARNALSAKVDALLVGEAKGLATLRRWFRGGEVRGGEEAERDRTRTYWRKEGRTGRKMKGGWPSSLVRIMPIILKSIETWKT